MKESQVREHIEKGWIRALITFEIMGKPPEHIEQTLTDYLQNIKNDHRIIVLREEREPAVEAEDGLYSAFSETELLFKTLETLTWICINFSPASVEILAPDEIVIESRDVTNWMNDLLANLHEVSTIMRGHKNSADHLTIALNQLITNTILLAAQQGPKDAAAISGATGIYPDQLEPFLKHLVEKKRLAFSDGLYAYMPPGAIAMEQPTLRVNQAATQKTAKKKKR